MKFKTCLSLLPLAGLLAMAACSTTPQMTSRPDFLSTYDHLSKVDATTWRYVSKPLLANCNRFMVSPVTILISNVEGAPTTEAQKQRTAEFVRSTIASMISQSYLVVTEPGANVAEIRVAVTEAYRTGGKLGLCVQGEILDSSRTQVAAVVRTELSELYVPDWENKAAARTMVEAWAQRMLKAIDEAHGK